MLVVVEIAIVEVAEPPAVSVTDNGFNDAVGPLVTTGETVVERDTVPANPPRLFTVIVDEPEAPALKTRDNGLGDKPKSGVTVSETTAE